jgi:predicted dehydrogenase
MENSRRDFLRKAALGTTGLTLGASTAGMSAASYRRISGANNRINVGVIGCRGQGFGHLRRFAELAKSDNVYVKTICDVDERLWAERVADVQKIQGEKPGTAFDMRKVYEDKSIDAISVATPNHWHALATIWAVQAGKDVYVEKPGSHNIFEGRKMIEAARKYNKIVQIGYQNRSINNVRRAMQALHNGVIGEVYMAKGLCYKPRGSFGRATNSAAPEGVHYDLWLGPVSWRPYNEKRFHYNWHWHWDTGNGDIGNQGPHQFDIARWGINKDEHPVKVHSTGGYYKYTDCSQETPNNQTAVFEYADGKILQFEVRGLYTHGESGLDVKIGNIFYGTEGWMELNGSTWKTFMGGDGTPGPSSEGEANEGDVAGAYLAAPGGGGHYKNFINAIRTGKKDDLTCDVYEGYMSTVLPHLANISYRMGGQVLQFNGSREKFVNNKAADDMLTREYRPPYVVPQTV